MHDVYICHSEPQVDRVLGLFEEAGIEALIRDRASSSFPTNVGLTAEKLVAVGADDVDKARTLISEAIADGVLLPEGEVLTATE